MKSVNGARWMIYGAYGYSGALIVEQAARRGLRPLLAGRNERKLRALAERYEFEWRRFALDNPLAVRHNLRDITAVLHCAGPFSQTARPMVEACLAEGVHYTDITGEIAVLEYLFSLQQQAVEAGIAVVPGAGFDVVPTDCLARQLAGAHPGSTHLALAFASDVQQSPGTWKSTIEGAASGGKVRRNGKIVRVPHAWKTRTIDFAGSPRLAVTIPWGDVSSAYYSTGIANIECSIAVSRATLWLLQASNLFRPVMVFRPVQSVLKTLIGWFVQGPRAQERGARKTIIYGEVTGTDGEAHSKTLRTPDGYSFTAVSALDAVLRVIGGDVPPGVHTPSMAFGSGFTDDVLREMGFKG